MKNLLAARASYFCLLGLLSWSAVSVTSVEPNDSRTDEPQKLVCEISVAPEVKVIDGGIDAKLIIKNVSAEHVRISGLYSSSRHIWKGNYQENFSPDWWRSNKPKPEKFIEKILTLSPNQTLTIPFRIEYEHSAEFFRGQRLTISSRYSISKQFAELYGTWAGSIEAKPVTIDVVE